MCSETSTDMPAGTIQQDMPCEMGKNGLQVWCYTYRGIITSDMSADPMLLCLYSVTLSYMNSGVRLFRYACL